MIIFLSGPVTYNPRKARRIFKRAERKLRRRGHVVLNPTILPDGMEWQQYMNISLTMLAEADGILLLPGWAKSPGANLEAKVALQTPDVHIFTKMEDILAWQTKSILKK
jgi:hypothetical protein